MYIKVNNLLSNFWFNFLFNFKHWFYLILNTFAYIKAINQFIYALFVIFTFSYHFLYAIGNFFDFNILTYLLFSKNYKINFIIYRLWVTIFYWVFLHFKSKFKEFLEVVSYIILLYKLSSCISKFLFTTFWVMSSLVYFLLNRFSSFFL
jgi:hypothetical protein